MCIQLIYMEDEDSGIFHSKHDDTDQDSEISYCSTIGFENDKRSTSSNFDSDSDFDALSTLSENSTESSEDNEYIIENDKGLTTSKGLDTVKKTLHLDDLLVNSTGDDNGGDIHSLFPQLKMKVSKHDEHWNFENGTFCRNDQKPNVTKNSPNNNRCNSKKVLSLQLSDLNNINCDSDFEAVKHDGNSSEDSTNIIVKEEMEDEILQFEFRNSDEIQCSEWSEAFYDCENIKIIRKHHLEGRLSFDALIIPGNSFGFLDGEPEIQYTNKFGWKLQEDIQKLIKEKHGGELIVGQAVVTRLDEYVECGIKYAIYVPVMRVPLQVGDTVNAYLAFRAALREVKMHNLHPEEVGIKTVLCPALCNGFGGMPARRIALQMRTAYDTVMGGPKGEFILSEDLGAMATNHVQMTTRIGKW